MSDTLERLQKEFAAAAAKLSHAKRLNKDPEAYKREQSRRGSLGGWPKGKPRKEQA